jgi:hypothetical protein
LFQSHILAFNSELTCWCLFQRCIVHTEFYIYVFLLIFLFQCLLFCFSL